MVRYCITGCSGHRSKLYDHGSRSSVQQTSTDKQKGQPQHVSAVMDYLNCFSSHMNWISPSSLGSHHFSSTMEQSTTSGFKNKPLASLYSQSSGNGCFCTMTHKQAKIKIQTHTSFDFLNFLIEARIYLRLGQCFPGSPQWSRAV